MYDPELENEDEDETLDPILYVSEAIRYFRGLGKDILATPLRGEPDIFKLYILGASYGTWTVYGLIAVLSQYRRKTVPDSYFTSRNIPISL